MKTLNFKTQFDRLNLAFWLVSIVLVLFIAGCYSLYTAEQKNLSKTLSLITYVNGKYLIGSKQIEENELDYAVAQLEHGSRVKQQLFKIGAMLGLFLFLPNCIFYAMRKNFLQHQTVILEEKNKKKNFRIKTGSFPLLSTVRS